MAWLLSRQCQRLWKMRIDNEPEQIIKTYSDMVYRLAFARTGTKEDADEVYQDVFLRLIKKRPVFESEEHCKAWLLRVTINCSNTWLTSLWKKRTVVLDENLPFQEKESIELYGELAKLPQKYRDVIHLFYYEELSVAEISQILHRKESTVRTQLTRARAMLREILEEEGYGF